MSSVKIHYRVVKAGWFKKVKDKYGEMELKRSVKQNKEAFRGELLECTDSETGKTYRRWWWYNG